MLNTNICIYIRQTRPPEVLARFKRLSLGQAAHSLVAWSELHFGAAKSLQAERSARQLEELGALLPVLPLPTAADAVYGQIRAMLEKRGETIGNNDLWIAAHALCAGLVLGTNNEREFLRVNGLQAKNRAI